MMIDPGSLQRLAYAWLPVLLDAAAKGVVLLAVAGLLALAMRKASAAARQVVWLGALAALLALPLASAALPSWQVLPGWAKIEMPTGRPTRGLVCVNLTARTRRRPGTWPRHSRRERSAGCCGPG